MHCPHLHGLFLTISVLTLHTINYPRWESNPQLLVQQSELLTSFWTMKTRYVSISQKQATALLLWRIPKRLDRKQFDQY